MNKAAFLLCACALVLTAGCGRKPESRSPDTPATGKSAQQAQSSPAAQEQNPQDAAGYFARGVDLYKQDRDREALEAFRQAVVLDPEYAEAYYKLGLTYAVTGQKKEADEAYEKAVDLFEKKVKKDPKDADALYNLADAYAKTDDYQKSAEAYRRAARLREPDASTYYDIGIVYNKLAKYQEATDAFKKAVELDPNDYQAQEALDRAKEDANKLKERIEYQKKLLAKQSRNSNSEQSLTNANAPSANTNNSNH